MRTLPALPTPPPSVKSPVSSFASLLLAPQLRLAYRLFLAFLLLVGFAFVAAGLFLFDQFLRQRVDTQPRRPRPHFEKSAI